MVKKTIDKINQKIKSLSFKKNNRKNKRKLFFKGEEKPKFKRRKKQLTLNLGGINRLNLAKNSRYYYIA